MRITVPRELATQPRGGAVAPGARPQMSNHQIREAENSQVYYNSIVSSLARGVYLSVPICVTDCSSPEHVNYPAHFCWGAHISHRCLQ